MNRGDAINILHKIVEICEDSHTIVNSICLIAPSKDNKGAGYHLKVGATLDNDCRKNLLHLLKEKGLEMEENQDAILIFKCH